MKQAAFALFVLFVSSHSAHGELVLNGGFETGDFSNWSVNFEPPNNAALIIDETEFPGHNRIFEGAFAVDLSVYEVPATAVIEQTVPTAPGGFFELSYAFGTIASSIRSSDTPIT